MLAPTLASCLNQLFAFCYTVVRLWFCIDSCRFVCDFVHAWSRVSRYTLCILYTFGRCRKNIKMHRFWNTFLMEMEPKCKRNIVEQTRFGVHFVCLLSEGCFEDALWSPFGSLLDPFGSIFIDLSSISDIVFRRTPPGCMACQINNKSAGYRLNSASPPPPVWPKIRSGLVPFCRSRGAVLMHFGRPLAHIWHPFASKWFP